jgi:hypothetical protein
MPELVAVGEALPKIQNAAKTIGTAITSVLGAGLIGVLVVIVPDEWDEQVIAFGGLLTLAANVLVTWGTRNKATVPLIVNPGPAAPIIP